MKRIFALIFASLSGLSIAQTVSTPVVGFSKYNLSAGQYVFSPGFTKAPVNQGSAVITTKTISLSGVSTTTLAPTSFTDGRPNYPTSYIEILSGTYSGVAFDITSVTSSSVSSADFPSDLNGQNISYVIRNHVTLQDVFTPDTGFAEYSDGITVWNSDGSSSLRYLAGGIITTDDFTTPAGHMPIYPGSGVILNIGSSVTLQTTGQVKATMTKVPVYPNVNNIVGTMNPSSNVKVTSSLLGSSLAAYADSAVIYSNNGGFSLLAYVFSDGSSATDDSFTPYTSLNSPSISNGSAAIINVATPGYVTLSSPISP